MGRIILGQEALEEDDHLRLVSGDPRLDAPDARLDGGRMLADLPLKGFLAVCDALVRLFADPGDLRLGPLADRRDIVVGALAKLRSLRCRIGVDELDVALRLGTQSLQRVGSSGLCGSLHGP